MFENLQFDKNWLEGQTRSNHVMCLSVCVYVCMCVCGLTVDFPEP